MRLTNYVAFVFACLLLSPVFVFAQGNGTGMGAAGLGMGPGMGMGAGIGYQAYNQRYPYPYYQRPRANSIETIIVDGSAEIAVKPESLRLVFAVTAEGKESNECSQKVKAAIDTIREGLQPLKITGDRIVEDFIAVIPSYEWENDKVEWDNGKKTEYLQEVHSGFRMQTNLHVLCDEETQALAVIDEAFKAGVTEIISFDYFHSDLDRYKRESLKKALAEAKSKSEILLSVFDDKPKVLNVENTMAVNFPESQYVTIAPTPANAKAILPYDWRNYLKIAAHRPKTTFYAGSKEFSDLGLKKPPMNPEIIVRSTIKLTYGGPARQERLELEKFTAENRKLDF